MSVAIAQYLANFGVAGLVLLLILLGVLVPGHIYNEQVEVNKRLERALELERQRNDVLQQMAATGTKAMNALAEVAEENRQQRQGPRRHRQRKALPDETPPYGIPAATGGRR